MSDVDIWGYDQEWSPDDDELQGEIDYPVESSETDDEGDDLAEVG